MQVLKKVFLLLLAGSTLPLLAGEQRQHGTHQHSIGKLDIAQEGTELRVELDSPEANIVGIEHTPKSKADHDTLEKALLQEDTGLFLFPDTAGCRQVDVDVATPLQGHADAPSHQEGLEHAEEHHSHEESHEHEGETHADITAV